MLIILVMLLLACSITIAIAMMRMASRLGAQIHSLQNRLETIDQRLVQSEHQLKGLEMKRLAKRHTTQEPLDMLTSALFSGPKKAVFSTISMVAYRLITAYLKRKAKKSLPAKQDSGG